ncbi:MAG: fumarylacetoacetate hydrolase family protein [Bacillota bacterium]|nr:fumarylacetoacetate hydrolase family protein [Bacillota bacterium]
MYILNYNYKNFEKIGFLSEDGESIIPADEIFKKVGIKPPSTMNELIEMSNDEIIEEIKESINSDGFKKIPAKDVKILSPIPFTKRNLLCVGKNYSDHVNELSSNKDLKGDIPTKPIYFTKTSHPTVGPDEDVNIPWNATKEVDYEVELAVVIGEKCKDVKTEDVEKYIFGYTIANDLSARDLQTGHIQWFKGKSLDNFSPIGPYILHKSSLNMPFDLKLECLVNDEVRQSSYTSHMIFDIPYLISDLSKGMTLYPGDIILTGTPSGVGMGFNPPKMLKSGDVVECRIDKLGSLKNKIV